MISIRKSVVAAIFLVWLQFPGLPASASDSRCPAAFPKNKTESKILDQFRAADIDPAQTASLSGTVFRVQTASEKNYVVRLPSNYANVRREPFAAAFLNRVPHLRTPTVRLLSTEESKTVLKLIRFFDPAAFRILTAKWKVPGLRNTNDRSRISLSVFYDVPRGLEALSSWGVSDRFRDTLDYIPWDKEDQLSTLALLKQDLESHWRTANPIQIEYLIQDLKILFPDSNEIRSDRYREYLLNNIELLTTGRTQGLSYLGLVRLPASIRQQLVDYWIVYTVLGIPDFHPRNWLLDDRKVIAIDLAHPVARTLHRGQPFHLSPHLQPFGWFHLRESLRKIFMSEMSPELRRFFIHLTPAHIQAVADDSEYKISAAELRGIMERRNWILEATAGP